MRSLPSPKIWCAIEPLEFSVVILKATEQSSSTSDYQKAEISRQILRVVLNAYKFQVKTHTEFPITYTCLYLLYKLLLIY